MDVHGGPARQPEPVGTASEGPVPAVQGMGGDGAEERPVGNGMGLSVRPGRGFAY